MIDRTVTTKIDADICIGCEACVKVCPNQTITMQNGKAVVSGDRSLNCGHCAAACPVDAVCVAAIDPDSLRFNGFQIDERWMAHGEFDTAELVRLMASRRSCRNFSDRRVDPTLLEDLIKIGTLAPSGTNSQRWTFTVLPSRSAVMALGEGVAGFFRRLNRMAERPLVRQCLKMIGRPQLYEYYRDYYQTVKEGLQEWDQKGHERLFHGATAAIVVGSLTAASCPAEDALLATQNILLAAHSMGLGTCLIGLAVSPMKNDPKLKAIIGIPETESVYAVIALGHPDESYERLAGRKKAKVRFFDV
jgi:nitroreductase/NAD-dependent dihydropyrimidine dehydrogenase PreA subunit